MYAQWPKWGNIAKYKASEKISTLNKFTFQTFSSKVIGVDSFTELRAWYPFHFDFSILLLAIRYFDSARRQKVLNMKIQIFILAIILLVNACYSSLIGRKQRVIAKGRLVCGDKPASNVLVKLVDEDDGKIPFIILYGNMLTYCNVLSVPQYTVT